MVKGSLVWRGATPLDLAGVPEQVGVAALVGAEAGAVDCGEQMTADARANAPWTDQSGRARAGLHPVVKVEGNLAVGGVGHDLSLDYPEFLEFKDGGRWGIVLRIQEIWTGKAPAVFAARINEAIASLVRL